ncbi:MAG: thioesterase family protein [Actinomycetota bacterium]|nr:thioesterase family protein [Actinomycetota bacterium]
MVTTALARLLDVRRLDGATFASPLPGQGRDRVFGGQILAQSVVAAGRTVPDDRSVNSLHALFIRAATPDTELVYEVDEVRDGRSFSTRAVEAIQDGRTVARALLSFHVAEEGPLHQPRPPDAPPPDAAVPYEEWLATVDAPGLEDWSAPDHPVEIRYVDPPPASPGVATALPQRMWFRARGELGDDPLVHAAALAWISDETLVDAVLLAHGRRWIEPALMGTSLDHAMWFHRPSRADRWLLLDHRAQATSGARGLARGALWTVQGELVATVNQEGLVRLE